MREFLSLAVKVIYSHDFWCFSSSGPREQQWPYVFADLICSVLVSFGLSFLEFVVKEYFQTLEKGTKGIVFQIFNSFSLIRKRFKLGLEISLNTSPGFPLDGLWCRSWCHSPICLSLLSLNGVWLYFSYLGRSVKCHGTVNNLKCSKWVVTLGDET